MIEKNCPQTEWYTSDATGKEREVKTVGAEMERLPNKIFRLKLTATIYFAEHERTTTQPTGSIRFF